jgi:signal transduction histidine kinase
MDEPTSALGLSQAGEVRALIRALAASGTPVLLITHDVEEVFDVADRVVVLQRGRLVFDGSIDSVSRIELLRMMSGKTRVQAAQILDAVSLERKRIERDLHDGAQQGLVTSALMLNMATERLRAREGDGDEVVKLLADSHSTLQSALAEMRAFSRGLQARVLERDGLVEAIQVLTDRAPVLVELRAGDIPRLDDAIERAAYFVVAESLTNSLKYADASRILIDLDVVDDHLHVVVTDDGVGFDSVRNGSGLQGLRDRAAAAHGELLIDSVEGRGTTITGRFPATLSSRLSRR